MTVGVILLVTSGLGRGGSESQFVQLATGLADRSWHVKTLSLQDGPYRKVLEAAGVPIDIVDCGVAPTPYQLWRLASAIHRARPTMVHTQAFRANLWARAIAGLSGRPVVASVRATYSYLPRAYYPMERALSHLGPTVTPSVATAEHLVRVVGLSAAAVTVIPNAVADTGVRPPSNSDASCWSGPVRLLMPGRLVPQKDHRTLIAAVRQLRDDGIRCHLTVAGGGPLFGQLLASAADLGGDITFMGEVDRTQMREQYRSADIVCLATHFEGSPNVLLEAMAEGRPVIASAVDGIPEIVEHGVSGLLVRRASVDDWVAAITSLVNRPALRRRFGLAGWRRVSREHTPRVMVERHEAVYTKLLEGHRRVARGGHAE